MRYTVRRVSRRCGAPRSEEHTSELQSLAYLVCRLLLEKKKELFRGRVGIKELQKAIREFRRVAPIVKRFPRRGLRGCCFFFNDTATTEIYTLSLHDALPIPPGVEPDRWNGRTHVSLVALQMRDVRIKGWRIPGFTAHPQVNFRTYVRVAGEPGVRFVRQFVPSRLIAAVGRLRYGEPFWPTRIRSRVLDLQGELRAEYGVGPAAFGWHVSVTGSRAAQVPPRDSSEHHFIARAFACRTRP